MFMFTDVVTSKKKNLEICNHKNQTTLKSNSDTVDTGLGFKR